MVAELVEVQLLRNHSESGVSGYRVFCFAKCIEITDDIVYNNIRMCEYYDKNSGSRRRSKNSENGQ